MPSILFRKRSYLSTESKHDMRLRSDDAAAGGVYAAAQTAAHVRPQNVGLQWKRISIKGRFKS